jgi:hypothetical protein
VVSAAASTGPISGADGGAKGEAGYGIGGPVETEVDHAGGACGASGDADGQQPGDNGSRVSAVNMTPRAALNTRMLAA